MRLRRSYCFSIPDSNFLSQIPSEVRMSACERWRPHKIWVRVKQRYWVRNYGNSGLRPILSRKLGYLSGLAANFHVMDAGGKIESIPSLWLRIRLVDDVVHIPWTGRPDELAVVRAEEFGISPLSGALIRNHLYLGNGPDNQTLAISRTRGGMSCLLP